MHILLVIILCGYTLVSSLVVMYHPSEKHLFKVNLPSLPSNDYLVSTLDFSLYVLSEMYQDTFLVIFTLMTYIIKWHILIVED